jgi:hypothetical protein
LLRDFFVDPVLPDCLELGLGCRLHGSSWKWSANRTKVILVLFAGSSRGFIKIFDVSKLLNESFNSARCRLVYPLRELQSSAGGRNVAQGAEPWARIAEQIRSFLARSPTSL